MIGIFIFISVLLILLSFGIKKHPSFIAGYKPNTPKEEIKFIQKSLFITGIVYVLLCVCTFFINDRFILAILLIAPILIMLAIVLLKNLVKPS